MQGSVIGNSNVLVDIIHGRVIGVLNSVGVSDKEVCKAMISKFYSDDEFSDGFDWTFISLDESKLTDIAKKNLDICRSLSSSEDCGKFFDFLCGDEVTNAFKDTFLSRLFTI